MIGKTISHYKILEKLGEGGMGIVYKAQDLKLDRIVALKFLPPHLTKSETDKARFLQEAKAAAALNHNNICTIHDIQEHVGPATAGRQQFIVMECVEGKTLRDVIYHVGAKHSDDDIQKKEKIHAGNASPLQMNEIIDLAIQIAEALKAAHSKGIVHRDIKTENIMVTPTKQVKVMDFGLAKLRGSVKLTKTSSTVGTMAYSSPEQLQGKEVDARTDIFSFGVVLYEMLTGHLPFRGEYDSAMMYSILNEEPEPVATLRKDITTNLVQIVNKSLEKDPAIRYQSMQEVLEELKKPISSITVSEKKEKSIIVLPFDDMSPNKDNEYFSDGLTEEVITDLSQIHVLRVISRNSAMMFKGTRKSTKTIGRELNVQYVLEGSVRKAGNNLRITAQLIDAITDKHLWAEKYSGTLNDVFDIQEKVSRSIVNSLQLKLSPKENQKIDKRPIDNVYAYECYLKANQEIYRFSKDSLDRAVRLIKNGLEIVGENELLYEAMGNAHIQYVNFAVSSDEGYLQKAEEWVEKLLNLNPNSSQGYYLDGLMRWKRGDWEEGIRRLQKSLALDPNNPRPREYLVYLSAIAGKGHVSRTLLPKLLEIDPLTPLYQCFPGWIEYMEGNFKGALGSMRKMYKMEQENPVYGVLYANFLTRIQQFEEAYSIIDKHAQKAPETDFVQLGLFRKFALLEKQKEALKTVTPKFKDAMRWDEQLSWEMAANYALIGQKQEALDWLENAVNRGFINYPFLNEYDPLLENIRGEERFKKLMERVKREWENFEV